ncbi:MAG TPA: DUF5916 domain-containing protein [Holophagaceae bacterium]|nr:DUF5916 domain-containing protein [Holophagaceae bacterium]
MRRGWALGGVSSVLAAAQLAAMQSPVQGLRAARATTPIQLDGRLDDNAWAQAEVASSFTEEWPDYGQPAHQNTEVRVLYDDRYLYVGARLLHDPRLEGGRATIVRRLHRRDQDSPSDWFGVFLDPLHDHRSGYAFWVNAAGVQRDAALYGDTGTDTSWDGVWESAVSVDADGWTAELRIPLSLLRLRASDGEQSWGVNFSRSDQGALRESSRWSLPPRGQATFVSRFPDLDGLDGLQPQLRREFIPYLSAARKFETTEPYDDRRWRLHTGLDAHLGLSSFSQVDLSVNPDFGQVEVDQAVLNLSTVETFFPEKRSFFLEGAEIFRVAGPDLFYSRRIGAGLGAPALAPGESLLDSPLATDISAAAKYTAKYDDGVNVGLLAARVDPAHAVIADAAGAASEREIYPLTAFGALRAQAVLDDRGSYVGGFLSEVHQAGPGGREATVAAVDTVFKSGDLRRVVDATLSHSEAGPKDDPQQGWRGRAHVHQSWEGGWDLDAGAVDAGRSYDPNDLGFLPRADEQSYSLGLSKQWDRSAGPFRNWSWNVWHGAARDQSGQVYSRWIDAGGRTDFTTFWSLWAGAGLNLPVEDDQELRTAQDAVKKYLRRPAVPRANVGFDTAGNRPWYVRASVNRSWFEGGPSTDTNLFQSLKLGPALELQLETGWSRAEGERRWLETQTGPSPQEGQSPGTPVTGLRRLNEFNQTLRLAYAFNPDLSVQLFSQWLEAAWTYRDLASYVDDDTQAPGATAQGPTAFSERLWTLNLITRWAFKPGSSLFVVYTHGAASSALLNDRAALQPVQDLGALRHLPSDDVVQMKLSWMFR